jgi:hypothetical protein
VVREEEALMNVAELIESLSKQNPESDVEMVDLHGRYSPSEVWYDGKAGAVVIE